MTRRLDAPELPTEVGELCDALNAGLRVVLNDGLASLYLYGALAFPRPKGWAVDVDFHALVSRALDPDERNAVAALHRQLVDSYELGAELDGYYVAMADAIRREPPVSQVGTFPSTPGTVMSRPTDDAWALHRAHVLAGRFVLLDGADPRSILVPPTWAELEEALRSEMRYIESHPEHAAFGILNACRILYSLRSQDVVVSKHQAAQWALSELPAEWRETISAAVRCYTHTATSRDRELVTERHHAVVVHVNDVLKP